MNTAAQRIPGKKGKRINASRQTIRAQIRRYENLMTQVKGLDIKRNGLLAALEPREKLMSVSKRLTNEVAVKNISLALIANPNADSGLELDLANANFIEKLIHNMDVLDRREANFKDLRKELEGFVCKEREMLESHLNTLKVLDEKVLGGKRDYIGKINATLYAIGGVLIVVPAALMGLGVIPQAIDSISIGGMGIGILMLGIMGAKAFARKLGHISYSVLEDVGEMWLPTKKELTNEIESGKMDFLADKLLEELEGKINRQKEGLFKRAGDAILHGTKNVGKWIAQLENAS